MLFDDSLQPSVGMVNVRFQLRDIALEALNLAVLRGDAAVGSRPLIDAPVAHLLVQLCLRLKDLLDLLNLGEDLLERIAGCKHVRYAGQSCGVLLAGSLLQIGRRGLPSQGKM